MHVIKACERGKGGTPSPLNLALYRCDAMHTTKAYGTVKVRLHSFFTSTLDRGAPMHAIKGRLKAQPHALLSSTLNGSGQLDAPAIVPLTEEFQVPSAWNKDQSDGCE
jgi:hypothetical protein